MVVTSGRLAIFSQKWLHQIKTTSIMMCVFELHTAMVFPDPTRSITESEVYGLIRGTDCDDGLGIYEQKDSSNF